MLTGKIKKNAFLKETKTVKTGTSLLLETQHNNKWESTQRSSLFS